jgi:hypothetical protein
MEVTELQTNNSLKNAFEPTDPRRFYSGLPSAVFPKIRKLAAGMMTLCKHICEQTFFFSNFRKNRFCSELTDEYLHKQKCHNEHKAEYIQTFGRHYSEKSH